MFTIKLYKNSGAYRRVYEAESFTILATNQGSSDGPCHDWSEITAHLKSGDSLRFDIGNSPYDPTGGRWEKAIIENGAGRTTEIIGSDAPVERRVA